MLCAECVVNKAKFVCVCVCVCVNRPAVTKHIWDSVQVN